MLSEAGLKANMDYAHALCQKASQEASRAYQQYLAAFKPLHGCGGKGKRPPKK